MVCPLSTVFHVGGGTLPVGSARKTYLNFRNNFVLLYKNLPSKSLLSVIVIRLFFGMGWPELNFCLRVDFPIS